MEMKPESATSNVKNIEQNILNDTNFAKEHTLSTPLPNVIMLGLLFLSTIGIIISGYIHGKMHLLSVLKNAIK